MALFISGNLLASDQVNNEFTFPRGEAHGIIYEIVVWYIELIFLLYGGGGLACDKCRVALRQWQLLPWATMEKVGMGWIGNTCGFQSESILLSV